jgi:hypothetical protein
MVPVMRRNIAIVALLGGLASGFGCHHIGGKSDCGYNPSDYPIGPPTPPYPSTLAPTKIPDKTGDKLSDSGIPGIDFGN